MMEEKDFDAFSEPLTGGSPVPKLHKKIYPWEWKDPAQGSINYWRRICRDYLVRIFDPSAVFSKNVRDSYNFKSSKKWYSIRASCMTPSTKAWLCNFGRRDTESVLFFGFTELEKPRLEFCFDIPLDKFKDRTQIRISDDGGYHVKGYQEFSVNSEKLKEMQEFIAIVNDRDAAKFDEMNL
jgi:hypothetical protein